MTQNITTLGGALIFAPVIIAMALWTLVGLLYASLEALNLLKYGAIKFYVHTNSTLFVLLLGGILKIRACIMQVSLEESLNGIGPITFLLKTYYCHYFANFTKMAGNICFSISDAWGNIMTERLAECGIEPLSIVGIGVMLVTLVLGFAVFVIAYVFLMFIMAFPFTWIVEIAKFILNPVPLKNSGYVANEMSSNIELEQAKVENDQLFKRVMQSIKEQGERQRAERAARQRNLN